MNLWWKPNEAKATNEFSSGHYTSNFA